MTIDNKVLVQVFGTDLPLGGCGCGSSCGPSCGPEGDPVAVATMAEQVADLGRRLTKYYGDGVVVEHIDVFSPRVNDYPEAVRVLARGNVRLPLTCGNRKPRFVGGLSLEMISAEVEKLGLTPRE